MRKYTIVVSLGILLLFGCDNPNSVQNGHNVEIPKKGLNPLPNIKGSSYKFQETLLPKRKGKSVSKIDWKQIEPILESAQKQTDNEYVAVLSVKDDTGNWYAYHVQPLAFSQKIVKESDSKLRKYLFEVKNKDQDLPRIAVAYIPDSDKAVYQMDLWLQPQKLEEHAKQKMKSDCGLELIDTHYICRYNDDYAYECVEVEVYEYSCSGGSGGSGDNDDSWNWPDGGGGEDCFPPYGCGPGGGGDDDGSGGDSFCDPNALFQTPACTEELEEVLEPDEYMYQVVDPDCSKSFSGQDPVIRFKDYAIWCNSKQFSGNRLTIIKDALVRIKNRNPSCNAIADFGNLLLNQGRLREFPRAAFAQSGGLGGIFANGGGAFATISEVYLDAYSQTTFSVSGLNSQGNSYTHNINLEWALVHEIEHAMGVAGHSGGDPWLTPNVQLCTGLN